MRKHINVPLVVPMLCLALLIGGCGNSSKTVTTIALVAASDGGKAWVLTDVDLPIVEDFRKNLHSGISAKIISAKAVSYTSSFMDGAMVLFDSIIEIHGQQHPAKILINTHYITHGKNSDGPFVNIPQPGESIDVVFLSGTYYGPIANLNLD